MTSLLGSCRNGDEFQLSIFFPETRDGILEEYRVQSGDRLEERVVPEPLDERVHARLTLVEVIRIAPGWSESKFNNLKQNTKVYYTPSLIANIYFWFG